MAIILCVGQFAWPNPAEAKDLKVRITSKPSGARVVLGAGAGKDLGATPLTTRLPKGQHVIVLKLDGHVQSVETVTVRRANQSFRFLLERAKLGAVRVVSKKKGALKGAAIFVDGERVGSVPDVIEVQIGARQIEVKKPGFTTYERWIEVQSGSEVVVKAAAMSEGGENQDPFGDGDGDEFGGDGAGDEFGGDGAGDEFGGDGAGDEFGGDGGGERVVELSGNDNDDDDDDDDPDRVEKAVGKSAAAPRGSIAELVVGVGLVGRVFRPKQDDNMSELRDFSSPGSPVIVVGGKFYPLGFTDSALLRGFGLTFSFGRSPSLKSKATLPDQTVIEVPMTLGRLSYGARYRYPVSDVLNVAAGMRFDTRFFRFDESANPELDNTSPTVDYKQLVVEAGGSYRASEQTRVRFRGEYIRLRGFGQLGNIYDVSGQRALGLEIGVNYKLTELIDIVGRLGYSQVALSFEEKMGVVGSNDHYFNGLLGAGLML